MNKRDPLIRSAVAAALLAASSLALAQRVPGTGAEADRPNDEQCAGVVKGGQNDCATSRNECHGHVKEDNNPEAWIYVPKGLCQKITGARVVRVFDPSPRKR
jgi:uncharacterized membrane protein